jgi:hypothetical protein
MRVETMVQQAAPPTGVAGDPDELSDSDLEHVVGGLVRAWAVGAIREPRLPLTEL